HRAGTIHGDADALSRHPLQEGTRPTKDIVLALDDAETPPWKGRVKDAQAADPWLQACRHYMDERVLPQDERLARRVLLSVPHMVDHDGILHHAPGRRLSAARSGDDGARVLVPASMRPEVLAAYHDVHHDSMGRKHILVVTDLFTKWAEAFPVASVDAATTAATLLDHVFCRFGFPTHLLSDRGTAFLNSTVADMCAQLGVHRKHTSGYAPQTNGTCERLNQTLVKMLSTLVSDVQGDWDLYLPRVLLAYNGAVHETTGETPALLFLGRDVQHPYDCRLRVGVSDAPRSVADYRRDLLAQLEAAHQRARDRADVMLAKRVERNN
ncbi:MAG: DDE-type integrase/transposase/recombinase, partial [Acinetobacter pittii]